jgi:hypothetical protein
VPLSQTAVFSAYDETRAGQYANIQMVDGKETSRGVFPLWVRVLPGDHVFLVRKLDRTGLSGKSAYSETSDFRVTVKDMKPRHVYVARFRERNGASVVEVENLGQSPNYAIPLGLDAKPYKAEF